MYFRPYGAGCKNKKQDSFGHPFRVAKTLLVSGCWFLVGCHATLACRYSGKNQKERNRYHSVQHHLSEFDADLRAGKFDKGKLDAAIDNLKDVVKNNTLESHDRDALAQDLSDLRTLLDLR
jgi:hypothetical protein